MEVFGCKYLGGRAESAPRTKAGGNGRVTIAEADNTLANTEAEAIRTWEAETSPLMPHLKYDTIELDREFPTLEAPPSEGLDDLEKNERDGVFQYGLGIARAIQAESDQDGRRRRPRSGLAPTLNLLEDLGLTGLAGATSSGYAPPGAARQVSQQFGDEDGEERSCSEDELVASSAACTPDGPRYSSHA